MPIDWESGKDTRIKGHPAKCKLYPSHSTDKKGRCKTFYKCESAGKAQCIAKGGT